MHRRRGGCECDKCLAPVVRALVITSRTLLPPGRVTVRALLSRTSCIFSVINILVNLINIFSFFECILTVRHRASFYVLNVRTQDRLFSAVRDHLMKRLKIFFASLRRIPYLQLLRSKNVLIQISSGNTCPFHCFFIGFHAKVLMSGNDICNRATSGKTYFARTAHHRLPTRPKRAA